MFDIIRLYVSIVKIKCNSKRRYIGSIENIVMNLIKQLEINKMLTLDNL